MIDTLLRDLRQPEYIHVLLNPLPIYGLAMGWVGLVIALFLRSRRGQIATLVMVLISAASAWPVYEFGQQAYDRVLSMTDEDGKAWLDAHEDRAEDLIYSFYALALLSVVAILVPMKWPKSSVPLALAVIILGVVVIGIGAYIAQAGGKIRHREFRNESPPPKSVSVNSTASVTTDTLATAAFASDN
jgi:glucan phosphoethanolaminetransferase (alkaline phosphatase superfamily)